MSSADVKNQHSKPGSRRGPRPKWDQPEESCGELVTTLPGGKHMWMTVGPAAKAFRSLSQEIEKLVRRERFIQFGISFSIYMIGRTKSTASPKIIFSSSNEAARKGIRKAVRQSGILKEYQSIGLGDSSPLPLLSLALGDSSLRDTLPQSSGLIRGGGSQGSRGGGNADHGIQNAKPSNSARAINVSKGIGTWRPRQNSSEPIQLSQSFEPRSTSYDAPTISSNNSICGGYTHSFRSHALSASSTTTPRTSIEFDAEQGISEIWQSPQGNFGDITQLNQSFKTLSTDCDAPTISNNSMCGESTQPLSSHLLLASGNTTPRTPIKFDPEQGISDTPTIKDEGCESTDSSNDYELFSGTDSSEELPPLDGRDPLCQELGQIVEKLLREFSSYRRLPQAAEDQEPQQTSGPSQQASKRVTISSSRMSKRPFQSDAEEEPLGEDDTTVVATTKRRRAANRRGRVLACPFWKKDPRAFSDCYTKNLKLVKDVKQHLYRRHLNPIRCPLCQNIFGTEDLCDDHVRERRCSLQPKVEDKGISRDQEKRLAKRGPAGSSQEEQWYIVWGIVFPSLDPPSSPYLNTDLSEEICEFREFYSRYGSAIILEHMRSSGHWTDSDERRFGQGQWNHVFNASLDDIHNRWLAQRAHPENGSGHQPQAQQIQGDFNDITFEQSPESTGHLDDADAPQTQLDSPQRLLDDEAQSGQIGPSGLVRGSGSGQQSEILTDMYRLWGINPDDDGSVDTQGDVIGFRYDISDPTIF